MIDNIIFEERDKLGDKLKAVAQHVHTYAGVYSFKVSFYINDVFKKTVGFSSRTYSRLRDMIKNYMFNTLFY